MQTLTINRPDDWHVHLRDGLALQDTVAATALHFSRALVMPNLRPALTTVESVLAYRNRILATLDSKSPFIPYMTLYLNESVLPEDLQKIRENSCILGAKLYPAGATTNSDQGTRSLRAIYPLLEIMQDNNLVLQIHGEQTKGDIFYRETAFIDNELKALTKNFPKLRMVLEHISTQAAVDFVKEASELVSATITPHHLLYNRNDLLAGGIRPHYYCLPILKRETDQQALQAAAVSANPKFFAGTDSAPHARHTKETACGCAGIYSAPFAVAFYTQFFDQMGQLVKLNAFMSQFGAEFYHLPLTKSELILTKSPQTIPDRMPLGIEEVIPMAAGEQLQWSIHESN